MSDRDALARVAIEASSREDLAVEVVRAASRYALLLLQQIGDDKVAAIVRAGGRFEIETDIGAIGAPPRVTLVAVVNGERHPLHYMQLRQVPTEGMS